MASPEIQESTGKVNGFRTKLRKARANQLVDIIADRTVKLRENVADKPLKVSPNGFPQITLGVVSIHEVDDHGLTVDYTSYTSRDGFRLTLQSETGDSYGLTSLAVGREGEGWMMHEPRKIGEMALIDQGRLMKPIIRSLNDALHISRQLGLDDATAII